MINQNNVNTIKESFEQSPIRLTYSFDRLVKKYGCTVDEIREAKKIYKESLFQATEIPENMIVERVWINTKGKKSIQLRPDKNEHLIDNDFLKEILSKKTNKSADKKVVLKESSKVLLVYTSDKHIGAHVSKEEMFDNEYTAKIFGKRLETLTREIITLDTLHKFKKIIILDLGDATDGQDGFTHSRRHLLPQNMTNREVFKTYIDTHVQMFSSLRAHCSCLDIEFRTVGDSNHGADMDWMMFTSLSFILDRDLGIKSFVGEKFIEHFSINDHSFIICHGKDAKSLKFPMPKVLDKKTELYIKTYIDSKNIKSKFVHFIKGDLHQAASEYCHFFRYKNVLSLFGSSGWIQTNFMTNTKGISMDILDLSNDSITELNMFL